MYITSCAHIVLDHVRSCMCFDYHICINDQSLYYHVRSLLTVMYAVMQTHHVYLFIVDYHVRTNHKHLYCHVGC